MSKEYSKNNSSQDPKSNGQQQGSSFDSNQNSNWFSANTSQNSLVKKGDDSVEISTKEGGNRR